LDAISSITVTCTGKILPKLTNEVYNFSFKKSCFCVVAEEIKGFKWAVLDIEIHSRSKPSILRPKDAYNHKLCNPDIHLLAK
jgi:hypothetical protein